MKVSGKNKCKCVSYFNYPFCLMHIPFSQKNGKNQRQRVEDKKRELVINTQNTVRKQCQFYSGLCLEFKEQLLSKFF